MLPPSPVARLRRALLAAATAAGQPAERCLLSFARLRFLHRLAAHAPAGGLALKGATLLAALLPAPPRASDNLDLEPAAPLDDGALRQLIADIAALPAAEDGLRLLPDRLRAREVLLGPGYPVRELLLPVELADVACVLPVRVCAPAAPRPQRRPARLPGQLGLPDVTLPGLPAEAVVAEKVEALARADALHLPPARWQDLYDLHALAQGRAFAGGALLAALRAVFAQRVTRVPDAVPAVFGGRASVAPLRRAGWQAWLRAAQVAPQGRTLAQVTALVGDLVELPLGRLAAQQGMAHTWAPGGPWQAPPAG